MKQKKQKNKTKQTNKQSITFLQVYLIRSVMLLGFSLASAVSRWRSRWWNPSTYHWIGPLSPHWWKPGTHPILTPHHWSYTSFSLSFLTLSALTPHLWPVFPSHPSPHNLWTHTMDELTGKWARLSLNTQESQTVPLAPTTEDNARVLIVKLFTKRRVNIEALLITFRSMWHST